MAESGPKLMPFNLAPMTVRGHAPSPGQEKRGEPLAEAVARAGDGATRRSPLVPTANQPRATAALRLRGDALAGHDPDEHGQHRGRRGAAHVGAVLVEDLGLHPQTRRHVRGRADDVEGYVVPVVPLTTGWTSSGEQPGNESARRVDCVDVGGVTSSAEYVGHDVAVPSGTSVPSTRAEATAPGGRSTTGSLDEPVSRPPR